MVVHSIIGGFVVQEDQAVPVEAAGPKLSRYSVERQMLDAAGTCWAVIAAMRHGPFRSEEVLRRKVEASGGEDGLYRVIEYGDFGPSLSEFGVTSRTVWDIKRVEP